MAITIALIQVFTHGSQVLYLWQIPGNTFVVYKEGLQAGILIFLKIISSTSLLLLFFRSLKLSEFLTALKELGLPKAFIEVSVMAVKYIFIFKDELANITKAQKARLGYRNLPHSLISMGNAGGILLDQAFAKSEELAKALKCRGYDGSSLIK
jgi:cobalt/nickel transport system permease protein